MLIDRAVPYPYNLDIMKKTFLLSLVICGLVAVIPPTIFAQPESGGTQISSEQKMVTAIEVKGNRSISLSNILAKIKTRTGQEYQQNVVSDDLKRLYNTGYFSDVRVDRQEHENGFKVIFYVEEKPVIEKVTFSRIRHYRPRALLKKMRSQEGKFLDKKTLQDDIRTIQELYEKKGLTMAEVGVEQDIDETSNKARLHFVIREGERIRVRDIVFAGNDSFNRRRLMRVIKTRRGGIFRSGYLKEQVLEEDIQRLKAFYEKEGFIDVRVGYQMEEYRPGMIRVMININEGQRYYVDVVRVSGNKIFDEEKILEQMQEIKDGSVFSRDRLSLDLANVRSLYFDEGYIFANIRETTAINPETGRVGIRLDIYEGNPAYVNKIKIQGNTRTRDIVIRRELRLFPGDRFDGSKLRRSKERLRNLGYFSDITYDTEDTTLPDYKNLIVQVEEAKTGSFNFGGGYSTVDNLVGFVEIEQKNFDFTNWPTFTGAGQHLVFRAEASATRNNFRLSFTEPWIMDYPVSGGFDLYLTERDRERDTGYAFDEKRRGGRIRFGKQLSEYVDTGVYYRLENIRIGNFEENASPELRREEGENNLSVVGMSITRDTRDNVFNPTKGLYLNGGVDVAGGPFAGDQDFYRLMGRAGYYVPLRFYSAVLEFGLRGGVIDNYGGSDFVPIFERFFAGGARTIRGYDERKVGPLDPATNEPIGGESMIIGNIELTVPVFDFMKVAAFYDTGNVWRDVGDIGSGGFKSGVGMGLRFRTPIGPINLDYGYPLDDQPGEDSRSGKFYFSVSRGF